MDWSFTREVAVQTELSEAARTYAVEEAVRNLDETFRYQTSLMQSSYDAAVDANVHALDVTMRHQLGKIEKEKTKDLNRVRASARAQMSNSLLKTNSEWEALCLHKLDQQKQHYEKLLAKRDADVLQAKKSALRRNDELTKANMKLVVAYNWVKQRWSDGDSVQLQDAVQGDDLPDLVVSLKQSVEAHETTISELRDQIKELQTGQNGSGIPVPTLKSSASPKSSSPIQISNTASTVAASTISLEKLAIVLESMKEEPKTALEETKAQLSLMPQEVNIESEKFKIKSVIEAEIKAKFVQHLEKLQVRHENEIGRLRNELEQCQENLALFQRSFSTMQNPSKLTQVIKRQSNILNLAKQLIPAPKVITPPLQLLPELPKQSQANTDSTRLNRLYRTTSKFG